MHAYPEEAKVLLHKSPESKNIERWGDMTQDDTCEYGEQLIDLLKLRAAQKDFPGTCEVCERWK
jgi:hypothetical protein